MKSKGIAFYGIPSVVDPDGIRNCLEDNPHRIHANRGINADDSNAISQ